MPAFVPKGLIRNVQCPIVITYMVRLLFFSYEEERADYKSQPPNNTIMVRGLAQHITENDVRKIKWT